MGVPAFFRWLSRKYPSIVVYCIEEKVPAGVGKGRDGRLNIRPDVYSTSFSRSCHASIHVVLLVIVF